MPPLQDPSATQTTNNSNAELQSAPAKLVETSICLVLKYEKMFGLEISGKFREPLSEFLKRFPFETLKNLLQGDRIKDMDSVGRVKTVRM